MTDSDIAFTEQSGIGYIMSSAGLHKKTIDLDTGVSLYEFNYDEENNLVTITDQIGNLIKIERNASGVPTAVVSPDGIRTELTIDINNQLTQITYPNGSFYRFDYSEDGLLTLKTQPMSNQFGHIFDNKGRITDFTDDEGGHWLFSRTVLENGDVLHETQTQEGDLSSYRDRESSTGALKSTITDPADSQIDYSQSDDGLTVDISYPCGDEQIIQYNVDSEYKFKFIEGLTEMMPSGLLRATLNTRIYEDTDEDGVPDRITETLTFNDKATSLVHDVSQATRIVTSPEGRIITSLYDPANLLVESVSITGLHPTTYGYDPRGRLTAISTNTRQSVFTYNAEGFLGAVTDPEGQTTSYDYDQIGRITGINRPDGNFIDFSHDANGNMTVLINPAGIYHQFGYNKVNQNSSYTTPISGSYSYLYDKDRRLIQTNFPSGQQINSIYENGRLVQTQTPEGNIDYSYLCGTQIESITKASESITYGYDGKLVTSETLSGILNQSLSYTYNDDFDVSTSSYAGGTVNYAYDNDGLLTTAGSYAIARDAENGLPESVSGGAGQ
jgi:YD repeat-containing protein